MNYSFSSIIYFSVYDLTNNNLNEKKNNQNEYFVIFLKNCKNETKAAATQTKIKNMK
jgi:hypothetical protein